MQRYAYKVLALAKAGALEFTLIADIAYSSWWGIVKCAFMSIVFLAIVLMFLNILNARAYSYIAPLVFLVYASAKIQP